MNASQRAQRQDSAAQSISAAKSISTVGFYPSANPKLRVFALWYFGSLLLIWNILGHTLLGFEQSWAAPLVAVGTACACQIYLELVDAWANNRPLRFSKSPGSFVTFLIPAMISGLAIGMLLYPIGNLWPFAFGAAFAIASKVLFRAPHGKGTQHFLNPSNAAIVATLLLFPDLVGAAPPYHFVENISGAWHWILPSIILATGIVLHSVATGRLALVLAWLLGFSLQGLVRATLFGLPWLVTLVPMTSTAFVIFTLYMVPDPATTPLSVRNQVLFGLAVAACYGILQSLHISYGLFIALVIVSCLRGAGMWFTSVVKRAATSDKPAPTTNTR